MQVAGGASTSAAGSSHCILPICSHLRAEKVSYFLCRGDRAFDRCRPHLHLDVPRAQRGSRENNDYVEFDDDFRYNDRNFSLDFLPATSGRVLRTLQTLTDRFVDVIYDLFPVGTSRSVVETVTKGGVLLVTLAFASSILTFLLNAGFVVLGLYVAAKVFKIDIGGVSRSKRDNFGDSTSSDKDYGVPPRRSKSKRPYRTDAGQAVSDLTDVWFERTPRKQRSE